MTGDNTPVRPRKFEDCMAVWGDVKKIDYSGCPIRKIKLGFAVERFTQSVEETPASDTSILHKSARL